MVIQTTYSDARANLARLCDKVSTDRETVLITRRGSGDVALVAAEELAGLIETAHLLRSPRNAVRLLTALNWAVERSDRPMTVEELRQAVGLVSKK